VPLRGLISAICGIQRRDHFALDPLRTLALNMDSPNCAQDHENSGILDTPRHGPEKTGRSQHDHHDPCLGQRKGLSPVEKLEGHGGAGLALTRANFGIVICGGTRKPLNFSNVRGPLGGKYHTPGLGRKNPRLAATQPILGRETGPLPTAPKTDRGA